MGDDGLWALEERLWREGASTMKAFLDDSAIMVFAAPVGILTDGDIARSLEGAPRWTEVRMTERVATHPAPDLVVLAYRAEGSRGDAEPYVAYASTAYRLTDSGWRLVLHQQTPSR